MYTNRNLAGTGFKFDATEKAKIKEAKRAMKSRFDVDLNISDFEMSDDEIVTKREVKDPKAGDKPEKENLALIKDPTTKAAVMQAATKAAKDVIIRGGTAEEVLQAAQNAIRAILTQFKPTADAGLETAIKLRDEFMAREEENSEFVSAELEINDYPQNARHKVTQKEFVGMIHDLTNCNVAVRGTYFEPPKKVPLGSKKLYMYIQGENKYEVGNAYREIRRVLEENAKYSQNSVSGHTGKYTV